MKYEFTFTESNVVNTTIYAKSKEEAEEKILNGDYVDEGGGDRSIHTIVCNSEEWEYPEDTWTAVEHDGTLFDLNFWTEEDKKMLGIYAVTEDDSTDVNTYMCFELKSTEGDIKSIARGLGVGDD
jgi:hypothetical protein